MLVLGIGAAFAFMAVILASTTGVPEDEAGLGLRPRQHLPADGRRFRPRALAAAAAAVTALVAGPNPAPAALNSGYYAAFLAGAGCVLLGALIAATGLREAQPADRAPGAR
jgi:hypothetical protein